MSLHMANGNEGGIAAWPVQDGSDASTGSHDRKMSGFEPMLLLHPQQQAQQHSFDMGIVVPNQVTNGTGDVSIVSHPDADRPLPANSQIDSSETIGRVLTDSFRTPDLTRNRSSVDTTSALGSSSPPFSSVQQHHHSHQHQSSQHDERQQEQTLHTSYNIYNSNTGNDTKNSPTFLSSDQQQPPFDLSSFVTTSQPFIPSGIREDLLWDARLGSGTPNSETSSHRPTALGTTQTQISPNLSMQISTTPQQSNLSSHTRSILGLQPPPPPPLAASNTGPSSSEQQESSSVMGNLDVTTSSWALEENKMTRSTTTTPEGKSRDGDDSTVQSTAVLSTGTHEGDADDMLSPSSMLSPASSPQVGPVAGPVHESEEGPNAIIGTPSTVSTAPSTEDASLGTDSIDKIGLKLDPTLIEPFTLHRRAPSWDRSPISRNLYADTEISASAAPREVQPAPQLQPQQYWPSQQPGPSRIQGYAHPQQQHAAPPSAWGAPLTTQSRVATFRPDDGTKHDSRTIPPYSHMAQQQQQHRGQQQQPGEQRWHQQPPRHFGGGESQLQGYPGQQQQARAGVHMAQQEGIPPHGGYRGGQGYNPYSVHRKPGYPPQHPMPSSQSPQRPGRGPRQGPSPHRQQQHHPGGPPTSGGSGGGSSRSSSEILKTLLRKKACLYEPDTSRAVALVTWLVGRELALEYGYFSRQQLQAGVHACVAEKIETGTITRTKVNRCMQIILNSCFHYIIPRPDGTEEKGHTFRATFEQEVSDDSYLLQMLPSPWNDLLVNRDIVLQASMAEMDGKSEQPRSAHSSPKGSPSLKPVEQRSPKRDQGDGLSDGQDSKRAVLLCFNENVRAAEDVFRCHNEFIRDSAHSSHLQLTAHEWRIFFGKEAASTPHIWGNIGIPVVAVESGDGSGRKVDVLGMMTPSEAGKFRTTWCAKRYDHDHEFCGMAHVEVNGGWLRRDPNVHRYKDEMCPSIVKTVDKRIGPHVFVINECPNGINCEYAHSHEELTYHPNRYKSTTCPLIMRTGTCRFGDICPNHHPSDAVRPAGKKEGGRPPGPRVGRAMGPTPGGGKGHIGLPAGSPILYASPAPVSSFERHLLMPGLQNLFRRQCTVFRAHLHNPKCRCCYSYFGDDVGIDVDSSVARSSTRPGLPPSLRM